MKSVKNHYSFIIFTILGILSLSLAAAAQNALSPEDSKIMSDFEGQAKAYARMRERLEEELPKLPKDASAEQIETHKKNFQKQVLAARANAKQGEIFTPAASQMFRAIIRDTFKGRDGVTLRKELSEAENKDVPVGVNVAYPDSKEQLEMPPALLLRLPQLPKQLRYRFVGTNLLLLDRENGLIVDYLTNAVP